MPTIVQTCSNCIYFLELELSSGKGRCRRNPPRSCGNNESPTQEDTRGIRWPMCWGTEWCGEWAVKT